MSDVISRIQSLEAQFRMLQGATSKATSATNATVAGLDLGISGIHWIDPVVISNTPQSPGGFVLISRFDCSKWIPQGAVAAIVDGYGLTDDANTSGRPALEIFRSLVDQFGYYVARGVTNTGNTYGTDQAFNCIVPLATDAPFPSIVWKVSTPGFNNQFLFRVIGYVD